MSCLYDKVRTIVIFIYFLAVFILLSSTEEAIYRVSSFIVVIVVSSAIYDALSKTSVTRNKPQ